MAILNDSTGTLMSCAWLSSRCKIGVIAGKFKEIRKFSKLRDETNIKKTMH